MKRYDEDSLNLVMFTPGNALNIESNCPGLTKEETLGLMGLEEEMLSEDDMRFFVHHYLIGSNKAKKSAIDRLFNNMNQQGGGQCALSYLTRFAKQWETDKADDNGLKGAKSYTVILKAD